MRVGLVFERKEDYPRLPSHADDVDSELLSQAEEDDLLSGLRDAGHHVLRIGDCRRLLNRIGYWRNRCDIVFNKSVGYRGVERKLLVPAILDAAGIPYVGSTPYVLTLTRHKYHTKLVVERAGVPTPRAVLYPLDPVTSLAALRYPVIVKPLAESSSIGIDRDRSVVESPEAADRQARSTVARYEQPVVVEEFVAGAEVEVPIVVDPLPRALGVVAIMLAGAPVEGDQFLASDLVYDDSYGFGAPPSYVDPERVAASAVRAANALGIRDYGRIDFRVAADGTPWFIEASTHPHLQRHSSFFLLAAARGLSHAEMLDELLTIATRRSAIL